MQGIDSTPLTDAPNDEQPEEPKPKPSRQKLALIIGPILAVLVVGNLGNAFHPTLLNEHPLWLIAAEPRNRYLLLVANKGVDYLPFVLIATVRRLASDPFFYLLGSLYGKAGIRWVENRMGEGGDSLIRPIEKGFSKASWAFVFFLPGAIVCALAGSVGMRLATFVGLNVAGTVTIVTVMYHFADVIEGPLGAVNRFYGRYGLWLTAVSFAFTFIYFGLQSRKRDTFQSLDEIERELEEGPKE